MNLGLGSWAKALEMAERGLKQHPGSSQLEKLHLAALLDCGRGENCRAKLVEGLERQARSVTSIQTTLTVLQDAYRRGTAAREMVEQALRNYPDVPSVRCLGALWALVNRRFSDAVAAATSTANLPGLEPALRAQCLVVAGLSSEQNGQPTAAETAERAAETANRNLATPNPGISMYLVDLLMNAGRTADALAALEAALQWSSDFGPARLRLAKLLGSQNQFDRAANEAEAALRLGLAGEDERAAHALLASTYFTLGNEAQAAVHEKWVAAHQPARQNP